MAIKAEFDRLKAIANELKADQKIALKDICEKKFEFLAYIENIHIFINFNLQIDYFQLTALHWKEL